MLKLKLFEQGEFIGGAAGKPCTERESAWLPRFSVDLRRLV